MSQHSDKHIHVCLCEMLDVQLSKEMEKESILVDSSEALFARLFSDSSPMSLNSIPIQFTGGTDTLTKQLDSTLLDSFLRNRVGIDS